MKIKELPKNVVMKIAAGEVVSGPNSVIKELIENSIDANSDKIKISISNGGKSYIKIEDNGIGMSEEDIRMALKPHTTSKIENLDDLYTLNSYGFRGEALASISEVSKLKMTSKIIEEELATQIEYIAGREMYSKKVIGNKGTTIEIMDLFFNIPARRKFLKTSSSESRLVTDIIEKFILSSNMEIFYEKDNKVNYDVKKNDKLQDRISIIFPEITNNNLIEVNYKEENLEIKGFISKPNFTRINRTGQIFFVNNRYIKSGMLFSILNKGYGDMLEKARHPYCVLFINISSDLVDVNVHPQKLEVNFSDSYYISKMIKTVVRNSILEKSNFEINFIDKDNRSLESDEESMKINKTNFENIYRLNEEREIYSKDNDKFRINDLSDYQLNNNKKKLNYDINIQQIKSEKIIDDNINHEKTTNDFRIVGIIKERYIIVELVDKLCIIDFHAAHERIIYEDLKKDYFEKGKIKIKLLLLPEEIKLDVNKLELIKEKNDIYKKLGFDFEYKDNHLIIKGTPLNLRIKNYTELIFDIADELRLNNIDDSINIFNRIFATMSCRKAVKTGDDFVGVEKLVSDLFSKKLRTCPHGRPIMMEINYKKLDNYFDR